MAFNPGWGMTRSIYLSAILLIPSLTALAADGPALDAAKYPQDTPHNALSSIVNLLEHEEYAYWITWLMTAEDLKRLVAKHGSVEKTAEHFKVNRAAHMKQRCELMKKMLAENNTTNGESNGTKWVRFQSDEKVLQFELQPDGTWRMNTTVISAEPK